MGSVDLGGRRIIKKKNISALQQSEAGLEGAKERVRRMLLGTLPNQPSGFEEALGQLPNSLDDTMLHATNTNPIIAQQIALIKAAQANIGNALSQFSPQVSANYGKQVYQGSAQGNYVGQLVVTVPIVQGGTAYGATQTAYAQLEAAEQTLKDVRLTLQENLKTSWSNWRSSEARISTSGKQTTSAASVVEIYWKQYQVGRRQILELLNAQNELYNAQVALITARFDTLNFRASVLSNMGRLAILYEIDQQSVSNVMPRMNSDTLLVK